MLKYTTIIIGLFLMGCGSPDSQNAAQLETAKDSISYSIGVDIGKNMKVQELDKNDNYQQN